MITVNKIEIENIRSLGNAVVEPLADGITAVNGPNGAGKSSILTAMLWAVYGVTPERVNQSAMRRQGTEGQPCRVVVEFTSNSQVYRVERGLKGRKDAPYMIVHLNGEEQAKGSIKAAEAWIVSQMGGLDATGFMTAFVIRQKELDGLVKAVPSKRRELIERLAGIDRMSTAVKTARKEEKETKDRLDLLPGDAETLKAARAALNDAQTAAADLWEAFDTARDNADAAETEFKEAEQAAIAMQARVEQYTAAQRTVEKAQHAVALAANTQQSAHAELGRARDAAVGGTPEEVAAAQTAYSDALATQQANQQAQATAQQMMQAAHAAQQVAQQAASRAQAAQQAHAQAEANWRQASERLAGFPSTLDADLATATGALSQTTEKRGALLGQHERLTASVKAMQTSGPDASACPTCATALPDPSVVMNALLREQEQVKNDGMAASAHIKELETQIAALRRQVDDRAAAAEAERQTAERLRAAVLPVEQATNEAHASAQAAQNAQASADAARTAAEQSHAQAPALAQAVGAAQEALRVAQVAAAANGRLNDLTVAVDEADNAYTAASAFLETAQQDLTNAGFDPDEAEEAFTKARQAQANSASLTTAMNSVHANFRVAEEKVNSATKEADTEELKFKARRETLALLEQKTAVRESLDEFRKDRIAKLAPELSEIATDLLAKMTDGKFTALELDEEFTPTVTDDNGQKRPSSWLSGGEESAVALALRLAIGEVIAGSQGGLLWMDEPQTAMDSQRRPAMMSVIRDLPGRQPIIISHVTEATDMVDLVLEVIPDEEAGSTVAVAHLADASNDPTALNLIA